MTDYSKHHRLNHKNHISKNYYVDDSTGSSGGGSGSGGDYSDGGGKSNKIATNITALRLKHNYIVLLRNHLSKNVVRFF